ncbi:E2 [Canis familiaris papillomavirus 9]|uniref:Regulatory protein E2 n=1 Tax=Canis familiaris papillomavirus 9 TaxID=1087108 RepID=G4XF65_9PAPI|nr:E2 [Canis familiaris papillomavirus 9]AEP82737.1 E2 [Canis familiaris papillomavirus 9]
MENLRKRLDVIQEELLTIYEEGSEVLADQVKHWNLMRKENVILHFAKKAGIIRLGLQPVPALRVSAQRAKDAIEMQLVLQTLLESPFAAERWNLQDTSRETWTAEPSNCFKKGPMLVEVYFDGDRDNSMHYTLWQYVYYTDMTDQWQKTKCHVSGEGLWFWENGHQRFYVRFADEAKKYGTRGQWDVMCNHEPICSPESVTSTTPPQHPGAKTVGPAHGAERVAGGGGAPGTWRERKGASPKSLRLCETADSTDPAPHAPDSQQEEAQEQIHPTAVGQHGLGRSAGTGGVLPHPAAGESLADPGGGLVSQVPEQPPCSESLPGSVTSTTPEPRPLYAPAASPGPGPGSETAASLPAAAAGFQALPDPTEEGPRQGTAPGSEGRFPVGSRYRRRPRPVLREAGDCTASVVVLAGPCNTLKCFRYRAKQQYRGLFCNISTTWYWAGDGSERIGAARILVTFSNNAQRAGFLERVRLPTSVSLLESIHSV